MLTAAELKKEQLKAELAALETAERQKKTVASQLSSAQAVEHEALRQARCKAQEIKEANEALETLWQTRRTTPQEFVELRIKLDAQIRNAQDNIRGLTVKGEELSKELQKKRSERNALEQQIANHPVYSAIRTRQREIAEQASKVVESFFETPLNQWHRLMDIVSELDRSESSLIANGIPQLRAAGLPDIGPILRSFFQQAVPHSILQQIPHERSRAFQEVRRLRDQPAVV